MDKHRYAMDADGNWVNARDACKGLSLYYCDCPERHQLKIVKPSGMDDKRPFADYFAHYGGEGAVCMHGGESMKHRLAKHKIREIASTLSFAMAKCKLCGFSQDFKSDGHTVKLEVQSYDKRWRYDTVLFDRAGTPVYALEVVNTHYSSQDKIDSTRYNKHQGIGFAEFMVGDILESTNGWLCNIRTLDFPDCPFCKDFFAEKRRLAIETEQQRMAIVAEQKRLAIAAEQRRLEMAAEQKRLVIAAEERRLEKERQINESRDIAMENMRMRIGHQVSIKKKRLAATKAHKIKYKKTEEGCQFIENYKKQLQQQKVRNSVDEIQKLVQSIRDVDPLLRCTHMHMYLIPLRQKSTTQSWFPTLLAAIPENYTYTMKKEWSDKHLDDLDVAIQKDFETYQVDNFV